MAEPATLPGAGSEAPLPLPTRVRKVLGRVRRRFAVDRFDVFLRAVPPATEASTFQDPPGYRFRWGTPEDVAECEEFHTELDERERGEGVRRLGMDHRIVVGLDREGLVVFTMWVNPRNLNVPGLVKRRLRPGQWFIYKAYTSPEHRGQSLYKAGMAFVLEEMRGQGLRELVGYAHVKKAVSRKGLARLDFASAGRITQVRAPGLVRTLVSRELALAFPEVVARSGVLQTA